MKLEILFGPMCLAFRKTMDFADLWSDPRGLTGSELGCVRIAAELAAAGHQVTIRTISNDKEWQGCRIANIADPLEPCDAVLSVNEPDLLRGAPPGAFRVCLQWLNQLSYVRVGFEQHVDLFASCSEPHCRKFFEDPEWQRVEVTPEHPNGKATYKPDPLKWCVIPLGCDPERYAGGEKVPGRVVYCSSPDRGLHWVLQEWPRIRREVPEATLHIYYPVERWMRSFDSTPWFPPIEGQRARALYVAECLQRFKERGGMGVTLRDSVSREVIEREMSQAETLAYPCQTTSWSEGFSCTLLEACAARACPITTDCDALGGIYGETLPLTNILPTDAPGEWVPVWSRNVIRALTDADWRESVNQKARTFAEGLTWKRTAERILEEIERRKA